jgi:hypothetical protein
MQYDIHGALMLAIQSIYQSITTVLGTCGFEKSNRITPRCLCTPAVVWLLIITVSDENTHTLRLKGSNDIASWSNRALHWISSTMA